MGRVVDVTEGGDAPSVLTARERGGVLGGRLLADGPLAEHLTETEVPQFVLRSKNEGLRIDGADDAGRLTPDDGYQALAAVTDVRVLVAVGRADGDVVESIPLVDVVDADADGGFVTSELWVATDDGTGYGFACRGSLDDVAAFVDGASQATVRAYRLLDEARAHLDDAADHLSSDEFAAALAAVDAAAERVRIGRDRLAAVGPGAVAAFEDDGAETLARVRELPRTVHWRRARHAHASARYCWNAGEYERAHDRYDEALDAYRESARSPGEDPTDADLADRRVQAETARVALQSAPLETARETARRAAATGGPAAAAGTWETAVRQYRDVLRLDWGREERRFDGDRESVRESVVDAVDGLVSARRAAALACRDAAADYRTRGADDAARAACRTAVAHVERARSIADELAPNRAFALDDVLAAIEGERAAIAEGPAVIDDQPTGPGDGSGPVARVADHWATHGWSVERDGETVVASRTEPVVQRACVRVVTRSADAGSAVVDCAERAGSLDADFSVVVTAGELPDGARERARVRDVRVQDLESVVGERTD